MGRTPNETASFVPSSISAPTPRPAVAAAPLSPYRSPFDDFPAASKGMSDLERQADDIIANFRARNQTGLDRALSRML